MSLFTNPQGFQINGGHFVAKKKTVVNNHNNTYLSGPTGVDILRAASAPEATHDSSARSYSPRCFPGTREQYITDIVGRATPSLGDTSLPVYWMKGPAGVGKSAIAQTCTERLQKKGLLGASFFFSVSGQHNSAKLFPSIAYQLSAVHPAYCDLLDKKISRDKTVVEKAMQFQFQYLIDEPLRELEESGEGIRQRVHVFIDGLDECEGTDAQCEIIRIIAASVSDGVLPLRWAFFSRPEPHIEASFSTADVASRCDKAILPISRDADGEIELYLQNAFNNILRRYNPLAQTPWPSAEEMGIVVRGAGGLFIYATTVVRFVGHPDSLPPQKRLSAIIEVIIKRRTHADANADTPFAELDAFYVLILQRIPKGIFPSAHSLLALLCRITNSGAMVAANLLQLSKDEFENAWNHVSTVIRFEDPGKDLDLELDPSIDTTRAHNPARKGVPSELNTQVRRHLGGRVAFYHRSFFDFLLDPVRSGIYCVKASENLANQLTKVHLAYDQSLYWQDSDLILAPGFSDSAASLSYPYTNELVNSVLKVLVYNFAGREDTGGFPTPQEVGGLDADRDFRKQLYIRTKFADVGFVFSGQLWGCESQRTMFWGGYIDCISPHGFSNFDVAKFKLMVEQREYANVIQRYYPSLFSRFNPFSRSQSQEGIESALYYMGRGEKSIFWYWEINQKLQYYREFRSIELAAGEKRFREEDFDSWPEYGDERGPK